MFRIFCYLGFCVSLLLCKGLWGKVIYVDDDASAGGDGSSWANAHTYLQDALAVAEYGDEIWVAEGTYKPDQGGGKTAGDRASAFVLVNGVGVYGGFLGAEATRDPMGDSKQTILSGEISEDSELWCKHVVIGAYLDSNTTLNGLIITNGNANVSYYSDYNFGYQYADKLLDSKGAGLYLFAGNLKLENVAFENNNGCDIYRERGNYSPANTSFIINNCEFVKSNSLKGSALHINGTNINTYVISHDNSKNCSLILNNCKFFNVEMQAALLIDTGYSNESNFTLDLNNCNFTGNKSSAVEYIKKSEFGYNTINFKDCEFLDNGRGIYFTTPLGENVKEFSLEECIFKNNREGGIFYSEDETSYDSEMEGVTFKVNDCKFIDNNASKGGGIYFDASSISLKNCLFVGNRAVDSDGGAIWSQYESSLEIEDCNFTDNTAKLGGSIYLYEYFSEPDVKVSIRNCDFIDNSSTKGGALYFNGSSNSELSDCLFHKNEAEESGGSIYFSENTKLTIVSSIFTENKSSNEGGTIYLEGNDKTSNRFKLEGCVFDNNSVEFGYAGGVWVDDHSDNFVSEIINCVFNDNKSFKAGAAFTVQSTGYSSQLDFINNVFTNNINEQSYSGVINFVGEIGSLSFVNCISWRNFNSYEKTWVKPQASLFEWHGIAGLSIEKVSGSSNIFQGSFENTGIADNDLQDSPNLEILDKTAFDIDPLFVNIDNPIGPDGIWLSDDDGLRLLEKSPAIDAGTDINTSIQYDIALGLRNVGKLIDIGAYEFALDLGISGDSTTDSVTSGDSTTDSVTSDDSATDLSTDELSDASDTTSNLDPSPSPLTDQVNYISEGSKWVELDWFGYFFDSSNVVVNQQGWIYQEDLGWLFSVFSSSDKVWCWSLNKGWLWTSTSVYPNFYSDESSNWLYVLNSPQKDQVLVFDYNPNKWTSWQDLTLKRMADPLPISLKNPSALETEVKSVLNSDISDQEKLKSVAEYIRSNL